MALPTEIKLSLVTPMALEFHGPTTSIVAPGTEGYIGVLPGHIPLVTSLRPGKLTFASGGRRLHFDIGAGYMEVNPTSVIIITEEVTPKNGDEKK
jgi:F-type H+-transporting ATPase subunit epsilon